MKSVLRITPNDTREMERPPRMRSGKLYEAMIQTFDGCAAAGAELLSIESVGGKEVHDEALMMCDIRSVIFALCVMGVRDMRFLWTELDKIARQRGVHCAGDTACGFRQHRDGAGRAENDSAGVCRRRARHFRRAHARCAMNAEPSVPARIAAMKIQF